MTKGVIVIMEFLVGLISNVPVITENKQTQVNSLVNITEGEEATRYTLLADELILYEWKWI